MIKFPMMLFWVVLSTVIWGTWSCAPNQFHCGDWQCIKMEWVCDSETDCANGRDEDDCFATSHFEPYSSTSTDIIFGTETETTVETTSVEDTATEKETTYEFMADTVLYSILEDETTQQPTTKKATHFTPSIEEASHKCEKSYCYNGGSCYMDNFNTHCRCQSDYQGKHCEILISALHHHSLGWIIALNLGVFIIAVIILVFGFRANRNVRRIIVHFERTPRTQENEYEIPKAHLIKV